MNTDKEWEARALELYRKSSSPILAMLQLGREMATERAAQDAIRYAELSEKYVALLISGAVAGQQPLPVSMAEALQNAADERAEDIARKLELRGRLEAAGIARSTITKSNTREQVLEEALREIRDDQDMGHLAESSPHHNCVLCRAKAAARRALEWKRE